MEDKNKFWIFFIW